MSRKPKSTLPGLEKTAGRPRNRNVSSTRVWKRRRTDQFGNAVGAPIFYVTVSLPGQKPKRVSTHKRIRAAAEDFAALKLRELMSPRKVLILQQRETQLELPPLTALKTRHSAPLTPFNRSDA